MRPSEKTDMLSVLADVRRIAVRTNRLVNGAMAGSYRSIFRGKGVEFDQVREYQDGDDPRSVDWNVTARVGRPFVKQHIDERNLSVVFLLDISKSMSEGFGFATPREIAARVIACIGLSAAKNNDQVGLVAFGDGVEKFVPIEKGPPHVLRMVRDTLYLPPKTGPARMAPALDLVAGVVRRRAIVFVVSDFLSSGWERSLRICARRHDTVAVRLRSPDEAPFTRGMVRMREPETGREAIIDWGDPRVREAYRARTEAWQKTLAECFRRAHVDVIDVPIPRERVRDVVVRPIFGFFRMRAERGAKR